MTARVPQAIVDRLQAEQTPTGCSPCHQAAVIEGLIDDIRAWRAEDSLRHRAIMAELATVKGAVGDLQGQFGRLALTTASVSETASHALLSAQDAARYAPDSLAPAPRRRQGMPRAVRNTLAAAGVLLASVLGTLATRCTEAHGHAVERPQPQGQDGP